MSEKSRTMRTARFVGCALAVTVATDESDLTDFSDIWDDDLDALVDRIKAESPELCSPAPVRPYSLTTRQLETVQHEYARLSLNVTMWASDSYLSDLADKSWLRGSTQDELFRWFWDRRYDLREMSIFAHKEAERHGSDHDAGRDCFTCFTGERDQSDWNDPDQ